MLVFINSVFFSISLVITSLYYLIYYLSIYFVQLNYFSLIFLFSGILLCLPIVSLLHSRVRKTNFVSVLIPVFLVLVIKFITTSNTVVFFCIYELFLLPSFLVVYINSPNRRSLISSFYFLIWTQVGSFIVLLGICRLIFLQNTYSFNFSQLHDPLLSVLFFIGFGIKIPVWPAHYWLTKTHVEAPTYFSIYLSSFLVKTALFGLIVFLNRVVTEDFLFLFCGIALIGSIDSSLKMFTQVDLKKLIAFSTVQEMNLILFIFLIPTNSTLVLGCLFIVVHVLLSSFFFAIIDSLYKRFSSRSSLSISGLLYSLPTLTTLILCGCLLFIGFPFSIKFFAEFLFFSNMLEYSTILSFILFIIVVFFGNVFFCKLFFKCFFGVNLVNQLSCSVKEVYFYTLYISGLLLSAFVLFY